jgi:hypothetical protein
MNPVNQGTYTQTAGWLPSQQAALAVWDDDDPYLSFGHQLLSNARPLPDVSLRAVVGPAIQDAPEGVLLNGVAPAQAAPRAAQWVNPPGTPHQFSKKQKIPQKPLDKSRKRGIMGKTKIKGEGK